ncbi:MAG: ABC transporter permease [Desulfuromonas sp.]|nr:MAG: ABC transporter permease [Desulfuromonas sp.]
MTVDLSPVSLVLVFSMLLVPLAIMAYLQLDTLRQTLIAVARMGVQLILVGLYLKYIFQLNNPLVSLLWVLVMLVVANFSVLNKAGFRRRFFFWRLLVGIAGATLLASGWFIFVVIRPEPIYDARYMVPIVGMILGNCLQSNVISLERFYSAIRKNENEFLTYLMLGATLQEAVRPYLREALRAVIAPIIATMATMGIVTLPGMMTGQILGGSLPMVAIKYQTGITISIFVAMVSAAFLNILLSLPVAFDEYQRLKTEIFEE